MLTSMEAIEILENERANQAKGHSTGSCELDFGVRIDRLPGITRAACNEAARLTDAKCANWIRDSMPDRRTDVVANAARLLSDAKFLSDGGRFASAFALAVIALEEIGKVILDIWDEAVPLQKHKAAQSAHLRKQAAVASLLLARTAVTEVGEANIDDPIPDILVERVAKALFESRDGKFSREVLMGALDKTKQVALYRDGWLDAAGLHADQFDQSDVTALFDRVRSAIEAVGDQKLVRVGRAIYEVGQRP
jgi:AbiV family abortive infection protein